MFWTTWLRVQAKLQINSWQYDRWVHPSGCNPKLGRLCTFSYQKQVFGRWWKMALETFSLDSRCCCTEAECLPKSAEPFWKYGHICIHHNMCEEGASNKRTETATLEHIKNASLKWFWENIWVVDTIKILVKLFDSSNLAYDVKLWKTKSKTSCLIGHCLSIFFYTHAEEYAVNAMLLECRKSDALFLPAESSWWWWH